MSKLVDRLAKKIEKDLGIKVDPESFVSIRPKPSYKLMGTWSWEMNVPGPHGSHKIGSMWTATECTRKNVKLVAADMVFYNYCKDIEVVPEEKTES